MSDKPPLIEGLPAPTWVKITGILAGIIALLLSVILGLCAYWVSKIDRAQEKLGNRTAAMETQSAIVNTKIESIERTQGEIKGDLAEIKKDIRAIQLLLQKKQKQQ